MKSVQPKDRCGEPTADGRNGERYFQGERHSNETHALTTAPDAPCDKKADGQAAKLGHMGLAVMENHSGLVVAATPVHATGTAEC